MSDMWNLREGQTASVQPFGFTQRTRIKMEEAISCFRLASSAFATPKFSARDFADESKYGICACAIAHRKGGFALIRMDLNVQSQPGSDARDNRSVSNGSVLFG